MFSYCHHGCCITYYHLRYTLKKRTSKGGRRGREERGGGCDGVREREECISSSQDFIWLFGQIGRIQNAAGACDVAIKRLPLIPPHNFFLPRTRARQNQLDQLWRGEAAAHPHKPLHHLSFTNNLVIILIVNLLTQTQAPPSPACATNFKVCKRWNGTQIEYPS